MAIKERMRAKSSGHFDLLKLSEHWKRKRRLTTDLCQMLSRVCLVEAKRRMIDLSRATGRFTSQEIVAWKVFAVLALCILAPNLALGQQAMLQSDPRPTIYSGQVSFGLLLSAHSSLGAELTTSASYQVNSVLAQPDANLTWLSTDYEPDFAASNRSQLEVSSSNQEETKKSRKHRQIFERTGQHRRQQQQQQQLQQQQQAAKLAATTSALEALGPGLCSQVNANALYAGMGAIWASHQANLVGDSHLAIGTYVYDSCNDLDVGQRQSVRIVSNLNAFQQTTCESPRGAPISLTIAHGDNQLRAIQLLTSFRVPVITTKEHFDLEDYSQLSRDQKRFLFTTAPSSRHLAVGALRFGKRIVSRSTSSPKLPNHFYKMSSKNGLIVISRNLPARFIAYLIEMIPNHVNYEMLQSNQPIDQIRSVEALESILVKSPSSSESKRSSKIVEPNRRKRDSDSDSSSEDEIPSDADGKMLSPTILMFITPSEAIDLVTRLRNDLAEVSRYYSLIVTTREDISPALKTIFHRGGSRLCSGKAFYTISPKPDDISEFSRYFRDTVQMEGETSDHPLICEFAKHQSNSKVNSDLDEISTEPVIKAVWSAAAAFKSVHRRECGALANSGSSPTTNTYRAGTESETTTASGTTEGVRSINSRQSSKSAHSECMVKMNKNMATLVQRALRRLDVNINSTGLQSLDGFRLKFDETNEMMTNKFSIKYINKECEITEIGHYSGLKDSGLRIDEETLVKSLESTLPDSWPVRVVPPPSPPPAAKPTPQAGGTAQTEPAAATSEPSKETEPASDSGASSESPAGRGKRKLQTTTAASTESEDSKSPEDDDSSSGDSGEKGDSSEVSEPPKRTSKRGSRTNEEIDRLSKRKLDANRKKRPLAAPVTAMGGRGIMPGVTDTELSGETSNDRTAGLRADRQAATTMRPSQRPMRRLKPYPSSVSTIRDWLPTGAPITTLSPKLLEFQSTKIPSNFLAARLHDDEQVDAGSSDLKARATTQAPIYSTLPESGGNADLELPPKPSSRVTTVSKASGASKPLEVAATTTTDYVTAPSISKNSFDRTNAPQLINLQSIGYGFDRAPTELLQNQTIAPRDDDSNRVNYFKDLSSSPIPLSTTTRRPSDNFLTTDQFIAQQDQAAAKESGRITLRSNLRWIYSSWFGITILGANICGALLTLYVLTFLLTKNCDGSLDRENQGMRSMHLLAIIVVFFGSTLFIVYPTPGLCLLRTSWQNFALVMLFGSLLLNAMQARSLNSLGLGGRPNRLNQFLTLIFMVGVQVSFELQRWKYESANYMSFVNQYFGASETNQKLIMLSSAIANQFNPLNAFNDQVTPVSIQVSEQYQNLLQDYCLQRADDFLSSQIYLCLLVALLVIFSTSTRNNRRQSSSPEAHQKLSSALTSSAKLVANEHEANLNLNPSHYQFKPNGLDTGNMFMVTMITAPIYAISIVFHLYGQNSANRDLISSVTMILIAFVTLITIFMPILLQIHRFDSLVSDRLPGSLTRPVITQSKLQDNSPSSPSSAFTMFPEFAHTGLRRPSSASGDSSSGAGSRRPFAETKESRRNMGTNLANLGPSADSLRSMGFFESERNVDEPINPAFLNLKLNLSANNDDQLEDEVYHHRHYQHNNNNNNNQHQTPVRRTTKNEKRLIMLDVDPCCPRHGQGGTRPFRANGEPSLGKCGKSRLAHQ